MKQAMSTSAKVMLDRCSLPSQDQEFANNRNIDSSLKMQQNIVPGTASNDDQEASAMPEGTESVLSKLAPVV